MRRLLRGICGLFVFAAVGLVGWMAKQILDDNIDTFRDWNSLYDYVASGSVLLACMLLGALSDASKRRFRPALFLLGGFLLASGVAGFYGFKYLSDAALAPIPPMKQLRPNAAETVLGYHYLCPVSGGTVAFGDGSVRYVSREKFASLRHADNPDQTPEFISPVKQPSEDESSALAEAKQENSVISNAQERIKHSDNLKKMALDHFHFQPRDGIRVPLKPEHFKTYGWMPEELRKSILDGTYVWYFGWDPIVSYASERTAALRYDFANWASIYLASLGGGLLLGAFVLMMKRPAPSVVDESGSA